MNSLGKTVYGTRTYGTILISKGSSTSAKILVGDEKVKENNNKTPKNLNNLKDSESSGTTRINTSTNSNSYTQGKNSFILGTSSHSLNYDKNAMNKIFNNPYHLPMIDPSVYTSWLTNNLSSVKPQYIEFEAPSIILIGDSIIEGNPAMHSRIHNSAGKVDLNLENQKGQISYYLTEMFGTQCIDQRWVGSRTDHTWNRWRRDVLGEVYDPNDTKGDKTLNKKAYGVIVGIGINDIAKGVPLSEIQERMESMADSCIENNIYCTFLTVSPDLEMKGEKTTNCLALNEWMLTELSKKVEVLDLFKFSTNVLDSWSQITDFPAFNNDKVHSTSQMNAGAAQFIANNTKNPFYLKELILESNTPPVMFTVTRPSKIDFESGDYISLNIQLEDRQDQKILNPICRKKKQKVTLYNPYDSKAVYWGFSAIKGVFERRG